jgi:hypothetical protein
MVVVLLGWCGMVLLCVVVVMLRCWWCSVVELVYVVLLLCGSGVCGGVVV